MDSEPKLTMKLLVTELSIVLFELLVIVLLLFVIFAGTICELF